MRGLRLPNFALPAQSQRTLLFYEFASGVPLVVAGTSPTWTPDLSQRFAAAVHSRCAARGVQSVVLVDEEPSSTEHLPDGAATATDREGKVRARLFPGLANGEGAVYAADPNLRVVETAAIERSALNSSAIETGLDTLIEDCLAQLSAEADEGSSVAPVLIIPRVLPKELCRGLIDSFDAWSVGESPMPSASGHTVDKARKSRLDAFIQDPRLEQELMHSITQRILPELDKAFGARIDRFERVKLVCYKASEGGHFRAHRDNTAPATSHRRFALTLNLNAGEYDGGELEFPEYGPNCRYDVATGAALLFSGTHAHRVRPVTSGERYALISFGFNDTTGSATPKGTGQRQA